MNATYNITNNRLFFWPEKGTRLPEPVYKEFKAAGFVWWPRGCFTALWSPRAEDLIKAQGLDIQEDDTPDDVERRVNRFEKYADADEQNAAAASSRLATGAAHTARQVKQAESTADKKTAEAQYWHDRISGSIARAEYRDRTDVIARRIKGLEADLRKHQKTVKVHEVLIKYWGVDLITPDYALSLANRDPLSPSFCFHKSEYPNSDYEGQQSIWSALSDGAINAEQAQKLSLEHHKTNLNYESRWVDHLLMRLEYEKAYLEAAGGSDLLNPVKKARRVSKAPDDGLKKGDHVSYYTNAFDTRNRSTGVIVSLGTANVKIQPDNPAWKYGPRTEVRRYVQKA